LVLDEPSEGLDPRGVVDLRLLLREMAADGVAILFASHLLNEVERVADAVVLLDQGRVVASGPIDALVGPSRATRIETVGAVEAAIRHFGSPLERNGDQAAFRIDASATLTATAATVEGLGAQLQAFAPERPTLEGALLERLEQASRR
ncbi:MAG: ABC transporter ATP-binding protein, partial [Planctomycetota bacterium]